MSDQPAKPEFDYTWIKQAARGLMRASFQQCGMPGCKAMCPGPVCSACEEPICLNHMLIYAAEPSKPKCALCVATDYMDELESLDDDEEPEAPPPPKRKPRKKTK